MKPYYSNIENDALENTNFRKVVWTGNNCQVVLMSISNNGQIGEEIHDHVDQFFRVESGIGKAVIAGIDYLLRDGVAFVVPAGVKHNVFNTGDTFLKLYTVYAPPNHIEGRIHKTYEDALGDTEDEDFGHLIK